MEYTPNLRKMYSDQIVNNLKGNYKSVMQVPKLVKICLNQGRLFICYYVLFNEHDVC